MIFGLGTARCGTYNLSVLLKVPHERIWLPWDVNENVLSWNLKSFKRDGGNVGLSILNYVGLLHDEFPNAHFICLQRDMALTVRSFVRRLKGRNPWCSEKDAAGYHYSFPRYENLSVADAAARYWREYYKRAHDWQIALPDHFRIFTTAYGLGEGIDDLLGFAGYERTKAA